MSSALRTQVVVVPHWGRGEEQTARPKGKGENSSWSVPSQGLTLDQETIVLNWGAHMGAQGSKS